MLLLRKDPQEAPVLASVSVFAGMPRICKFFCGMWEGWWDPREKSASLPGREDLWTGKVLPRSLAAMWLPMDVTQDPNCLLYEELHMQLGPGNHPWKLGACSVSTLCLPQAAPTTSHA